MKFSEIKKITSINKDYTIKIELEDGYVLNICAKKDCEPEEAYVEMYNLLRYANYLFSFEAKSRLTQK